MRLKNLARVLIGVGSLVAASLARADDALPDIGMLPCDGACAAITDPVGVIQPVPQFPPNFDYGDYVEGVVELQFMIGADGHVSDISVVQLIGPPQFAERSKETVAGWVYKPATLGGQPIALSHRLVVFFRVPNAPAEGRPETTHAYIQAVALTRDGKLDDAFAKLTEAMAQPKLNFYERGMLTNLMALIALQKHDYAEARHLAGFATSFGAQVLSPGVLREIWHTVIIADLNLGDVAGAVRALEGLKHTRGFDPADPMVALVNDTRAKADGIPALTSEGKIPPASEADMFTFELFRRNFSFRNITGGGLQRFTMNCRQRSIESQVSDQAEWHVPKTWDRCVLNIHGIPGTTFQIVQFAS